MKPTNNMRNSFRKLKISTSSGLDEKIHEEISRASGQTNKNILAQPALWRIIMKSKSKYKIAALLCCIILVSGAAAMTIPGVYNTIKTFITALDEKNFTEIINLADPMSAIPQQIDDINKLANKSKIKLERLYADDNNAIAFTSDVIVINDESDRSQDQKGPLVITLTKKENMWVVIDIDLENEETIKTELERFFEYHPNAIEINVD